MRDTKPNLSNDRFEQFDDEILSLSGETEIYGKLEIEQGAEFNIYSSGGTKYNFGLSDEGGILINNEPINTPTRESMTWYYNLSTTDQDPGTNNFNTSNSDLSQTTWVNFSKTMRGIDISSYIDDLISGSTVIGIQIDDDTKYLSFISNDITEYSTYVHVPVAEVVDSGVRYDSGATVTTNFSFKQESSGGGHVIKQDADGSVTELPQQTNLTIKTNGETAVTNNVPNNSTDVELKLAASVDLDVTGLNAGDLISRNPSNDGYEHQATKYDETLLSSTEENISSDGLLSTMLLADYGILMIKVGGDGVNAIGGLNIGSTSGGTDIVNNHIVGTGNTLVAVELEKSYFNKYDDTDLYVSNSNWNGGSISIEYNFIKGGVNHLKEVISTREVMSWTYNTGTTDQDPGTNNFSTSNVDLTQTAWINFSKTMRGIDVSSYIDDLTSGSTIIGIQIDDDTKYLSFISNDITEYSTYVHVPVVEVVDSGVRFDSGATVTTNFSFKQEASGGSSKTIKQDADGVVTELPQQNVMTYKTNGTSIVTNNVASGSTDIELKLVANTDVDISGINAGDLISRNPSNDGYEHQATMYDETLLSCTEANISSGGILSTTIQNNYSLLGIRVEGDSSASGQLIISSSSGHTGDIGTINLTNNINEPMLLNNRYFSDVDDTEIYVTGITAGSVNLYFYFIEGVLSDYILTNVFQTLVSSTSINMNVNNGKNATLVLAHNATLTLSNLSSGDQGSIIITQDGVGNRTISLSPTPKIKDNGAGTIALSTGSTDVDIIKYIYDGSNLFAKVDLNFT
jgi:hypothetical protein